MSTGEESSAGKGGQYKEYGYTPVATKPLPTSTDSTLDPEENQEIEDRVVFTRAPQVPETMVEESGSKSYQFVAAIAANLCIIAGGAVLGWTSPVLGNLKANVTDPDLSPLDEKITDEEGSWIGSLTPVGALVGSFAAGYLAETIGRKQTLLSTIIPFGVSWVLIATATSVGMLYAARFIGGLAIAFAFTVVPMYAGEIAEPSIRGILGSFLQVFITVGLLWAYCIGPYVTYTVFWITCMILPVVFFIVFFFMPESPYFLSARGKHSEVITALAKLRGKSTDAVKAEADEIKASVEEAFKNETSIMDLYRVKSNFRALIYTSALVTFQQMTGINVVLFYSQTIFDATKPADDPDSGLAPSVSTIIVGVVQIGASCVTPLVVDRLGRKILLIFSGVGETVSLIALGLFFYLKKQAEENNEDISSLGWLPVTSLMIFIATYCVGWGPLPWAVMGEMFASDVKAKASGITVFVCWTLAFLITKFFSNVEAAFGMYTAFWLFAVFCVLSILFTIFILPETKGKSLQQIQEELGGGSGARARHSNGSDARREKHSP
ncbi:facilitated trehalose transporter Tret1-like [Diachasmimorpha longicaudata]|uniref:facilitated trehalose transporter Tret1-like n=1 Tax=Diachasmimorpha longicaudata TaxID=58733 RepID=UPI0030B8E24A